MKEIRNAVKAFTLIELLIVISTIGLLVIVGVSTYKLQLLKSYDSQKKADLHNIKIALEEYEKDKNCYPPSLPACDPGDGLRPYIKKIPCEPKTTSTNYLYYPDPTSSCPKWFYVFASLGNKNDQQSIDMGCQYGCGPNSTLAVFNYFDKSPNAPVIHFGTESASARPTSIPPTETGYYGCIGGSCQPIGWNMDSNLPECQPNYTFSNCAGLCSDPVNECRD